MVTRVSAPSAAEKPARKTRAKRKPPASSQPDFPDERMSKVDTAWLRMDNEANLMQIIGVWQLAPGVNYAAVCARIENTLTRYNRFRQCAVADATGASWVLDQRFDLAQHVVLEKLPCSTGHGQERALQDRVAALATERLDRSRPLWKFHLIEDYTASDGVRGSAMILRIHHCIADGIALIAVTMSMVDGGAPPPTPDRPHAGAQDAQDWVVDALLKPFTELAVTARRAHWACWTIRPKAWSTGWNRA